MTSIANVRWSETSLKNPMQTLNPITLSIQNPTQICLQHFSRLKFTGNQTTSHLLSYSSIIICLNGVFIKCVRCYSRKFLLRFVVFLIVVHYLTFGRGLHLKNTQLTHNNRTNFSNDCKRIERKKTTNKLLNSIFRIMRTTNVPPLKAFSIYEFC